MALVRAVRRRLKLSAIACAPSVVLKTSWTPSLSIRSTICGLPSSTLLTIVTGNCASWVRNRAVPIVATRANPISTRRRQGSTMPALSRSRTETKTAPASGRSTPAPSCDLAKARPKSASSPMTSPVERISGPRMRSTPGKRAKGNTASLTATCPPGARVDLEDVDVALLDRVLHVHQPDDPQGTRQRAGLPSDLGDDVGAERI